MFAMYDDDGLNFRSTIDRLYQINEVDPSQSVNNNTKDEQNKNNFKQNLGESVISIKAKEKYKQMASLDTSAEVYHVSEIMTHPVMTVKASTSVKECYELMIEHGIKQLPISSDNGVHLKGMVTFKSILELIMDDVEYAKKNQYKEVSSISSSNVITTDPVSDIRRVAKVMSDFNLNALPVVNDNDILVGIVSKNDIIKAVASSLKHIQMWA